MRAFNVTRFLISSGIFMIAFLLVVAGGFYRRTVTMESATFKVNLPVTTKDKKLDPVVFSIQNEGLPKRLFQPGKISFGTGHGGGLTNKGQEPFWVEVKTTGFPGKTKITSTNLFFDGNTRKFQKPLNPGESFVVTVEVSIPRKDLNKSDPIATGNIVFNDSVNGELLAMVPVEIVNSKLVDIPKYHH